MKAIAALLLLLGGQSAEAMKLLPRHHRSFAQTRVHAHTNPEVSDIMELADDKEYMESQRGILAEQDMKDTTKYSMSASQYNNLMQHEHEREVKEKADE